MRVLKPIFATLFLCLAIPAMALAFAAVADALGTGKPDPILRTVCGG